MEKKKEYKPEYFEKLEMEESAYVEIKNPTEEKLNDVKQRLEGVEDVRVFNDFSDLLVWKQVHTALMESESICNMSEKDVKETKSALENSKARQEDLYNALKDTNNYDSVRQKCLDGFMKTYENGTNYSEDDNWDVIFKTMDYVTNKNK